MKSLLFLLFCLSASAKTVTLTWEVGNPLDALKAYMVYERLPIGPDKLLVGQPATDPLTATINDVPEGSHSYYVTAVNMADVQSPPSNFVSVVIPTAPKNLKIQVSMMESDDGQTWSGIPEAVAVFTVPANERRKLFRGDIQITTMPPD